MDRVLDTVRLSQKFKGTLNESPLRRLSLRVPLMRVRFADSHYSRLNHYLKIALHCPLSYVGEGQCKAIAVFVATKAAILKGIFPFMKSNHSIDLRSGKYIKPQLLFI